MDGTLRTGRLHAQRLLRGNRVWAAAIAVALVDIAAIGTHFAKPDMETLEIFQDGIRYGYFSLLVFLVPFLITTGMIAEEVEGRTLTYLLVRPIPRAALALGKFLAGSLASIACLAGGLFVLHLGLFALEPALLVEELPATMRILGSLALLALLYGAVCAFWGALVPEGATVVSTVFLGFFEFFFSGLPGTFRYVSMNHWASDLAGLERGGLLPESVPVTELWVTPLPIAGELVVFVLAMVLVISHGEFRFGRA